MWFISYGYFLIFIAVNDVTARVYQLIPHNDQNGENGKYIRSKRQFGFDDNSGFGFSSQGFPNNDIFFDEENSFQDSVQPSRSSGNQNSRFQNNPFENNPNFFDDFGTPTTPRPTTQRPPRIPGMGTPPSACEDRCLTTHQYNPVCGDNNVTYSNIERFKCAVRCGRNVKIAAYRACPRIMV